MGQFEMHSITRVCLYIAPTMVIELPASGRCTRTCLRTNADVDIASALTSARIQSCVSTFVHQQSLHLMHMAIQPDKK